MRGASTFNFDVYVPSGSNLLAGLGEFTICCVKAAGSSDSYVGFSSTATNDDLRFAYDTWCTVSVDISVYADKTTLFNFVIAAGNTIYIKDLAFS